jgi:hypothetical protein
MIRFAPRASAVLYNVLRSRGDSRPYLVPANVCPIVPATFLEARCRFELVDVEEPWLTINMEKCASLVAAKRGAYAGLVFVRSYGSEIDPTPFFAELLSLQGDFFLIDDRCLCRPDPDGESISSLADVTLFSTGRAKYVDLGYGGFAHVKATVRLESNDRDFDPAALSEVERRHKMETSPFAGNVDGWLDLREPRTSWDEFCRAMKVQCAAVSDRKARINAIYDRMLPREIHYPAEMQNWRFNIAVPKPDELLVSIFASGLFASRHYASVGALFGRGEYPVADAAQTKIVNLFNDFHFDERRAEQTADRVLRHLERTRN